MRMIVIGLAAATAALAASPAPGPAPLPPALAAELRSVMQTVRSTDYALRQVAALCNGIGPRLSGSPQAALAEKYVAAELARIGLAVRLQPIKVPKWSRGAESGALVDWPGRAGRVEQLIVLAALGGSVATPAGGLTAPVIVVKSFGELEALGRKKVAGSIVLWNRAFDVHLAGMGHAGPAYGQAVAYRSGGAIAAAKLGAVASLVRSVGGASYRLPHTGTMKYDEAVPKVPAAAVSAEDADLIAYHAARGATRMRLVLTPRREPDGVGHNVIGDLKGSERPEQIVLGSGHLDAWDLGTGAIDDAVGVAAAMQVAQAIRSLGLKPKRTIRVVAWMNEESGGTGGKDYAKDEGVRAKDHVAAIEMDLGCGHAGGLEARCSKEALAALKPVMEVLDGMGAGVLDPTTGSCGVDIAPLEAMGVPSFHPLMDTRTYFDYHHTAADTFDKVSPGDLAANSAVLAVLCHALASMPEPLPR